MLTTHHIRLTERGMEIAARHATAAGVGIEEWVDKLIAAQDIPDATELFDDMGFPSPRIPSGNQTKITNTLCHRGV